MTIQHVVSGPGAPTEAPPSICAHYRNESNGDLYLARGTTSVSDWVKQAGSGSGPTKEDFYTLIPNGYYGTGDDDDGSAIRLFNRRELGCVFYGGLQGSVGVTPVYRVGVGPDIAFGDFDRWRIGVADCGHVYTIVDDGVSPYIGIAPPAGVFGALELSARSFGQMYNEQPAVGFTFNVSLQVPALASGDVLLITVKVPGFSQLQLTMNPVTREWTCDGISIGIQGEYITPIVITAGEPGGQGHPETASVIFNYKPVSVPLSTNVYADSSGLSLSVRAGTSKVFRLGRVGGWVVYPDYD